jgi:hypothetical protein
MNIRQPYIYLGIIGLFSFAPCVFSQASMDLTSAGNNILAGVYVGPYYATINGQANVPIICDDFTDDSYVGETWKANTTTVSSNAATMMSTRMGLSASAQQADYGQAAYLAQQLMSGATCPPGTTSCASSDYAGDIQFAIWQIFDPAAKGNPLSYLSGSDYNNAVAWLNYASAHAPSYSTDSGVTVYSPQGGGPPQEFLGMPEPGAPLTWALDLGGLGGLVFYVRRRSQGVPAKG